MSNRILKESICSSEDLDKLSPMAEILFYRLIVKADDYGAFYGNISLIRCNCFPLKTDAITCEQVSTWLKELVDAGLIFLYRAEGRDYLRFRKWAKHQQIRSKKSKYPEPDSNGNQMISDDCKCPRNPIQSNTESNTSTKPIRQADGKSTGGKSPTHSYGVYGWVKLTDEQYKRLLSELGQTELDRCIQYVDESAQATGNRNNWKDWNLIVRKCHRDGWGIRQSQQQKSESGPDLSWRNSRPPTLDDMVEYPEGSGQYLPRWEVTDNA